MSLLSSWTYPLQGVICLTKTPQLRRLVERFLVSVTATSAATTAACLYFFYSTHVDVFATAFGGSKQTPGLFSRLAAALVVLAESTLPVYLLFDRRFEQLQAQLFDATLQLRGTSIGRIQPAESSALEAAVEMRRRQRTEAAAAARAAWRGAGLPSKAAQLLLGGVTNVRGFLAQLVVKPEPHEGWLIRKARGLATAFVAGVVPPLLPLLALRDSGTAAAHVLGRYWDKKGVPHNPDARVLVLQQNAGLYRSFGLVTASLGYVPVLNWLLGLSNMVGAALLAADMEKKHVPLFVDK